MRESTRGAGDMADEEPAQEVEQIPFEFDAYTYIADKGPVTAFGLAGDTPDTVWYHTLRIFGLRAGYSTVAGVPGYYLVNKTNAAEDKAAVSHALPAILHPADDGLPPVFGLYWKIGANGNIYAVCIGTDVKQSTDNDGVDTWIADKDAVPRRIDLFKSIQPIENRDGQQLAKKFDAWAKDHSAYFRELKIRSLIGARAWLSPSNFIRQSQVVYRNAEAAIRSSVKDSSGATADNSKKKKKSKQSTVVDPAVSAEISRRSAVLDSAVQPLLKYIQTIAVPDGNRIIEVDFGATEKEMDPEELESLIRTASPGNWTEAVLELLKTSDKVKLMQTGQAKIPFHSSPLPTPYKPPPEPAAASTTTTEVLNSDEESDEEPYAFLHKRKRTPPVTHVDLDAGAAAAAKGRGRTSKKPVLTTAASDSEKKTKAQVKSGIHSKDPLVAAAARANVRIPSDSEPG